MSAPPGRDAPCKVPEADKLPGGFRDVAGLLGEGPLLRLIEAHGGTRLYVPQTIDEHHPLAVLLGTKPARRLAASYGRDTLVIPLCKRWRVHVLRARGHTHAVIGRMVGMHEQTVYRTLSDKAVSGKVTDAAGRLERLSAQGRLALD